MPEQTKNTAAILSAIATPLVLEQRAIPTPGPNEILIRNHAIALNPIDWKRQAWGFAIPSYPVILGSDISGVVTSIGPSVSLFSPGDRVFGYSDSFQSGNNDHAAYQTYTIVSETSATKLPDTLTFEQGASLSMGAGTATIALFSVLGLDLPTKLAKEQDSVLLVWGGSSSVGTATIQLAKLLGFTVLATASAVHHSYVKGLGASQVFDYHSPSIVDDIVNAAKRAGKSIKYAVDVISEPDTLKPTVEVLEKSGGKKLAHTLPWPESEKKPEGIEVGNVEGETIWTKRKDLSKWLFNGFLEKALEEGTLVPSPEVEIVEGGLGGLQGGLDLLKSGVVSGKKLVVKLE